MLYMLFFFLPFLVSGSHITHGQPRTWTQKPCDKKKETKQKYVLMYKQQRNVVAKTKKLLCAPEICASARFIY